jgi:hypothetical protein
LKEGFAKPHQKSSRTLIRDLRTSYQLLNEYQRFVTVINVGFAKLSEGINGNSSVRFSKHNFILELPKTLFNDRCWLE